MTKQERLEAFIAEFEALEAKYGVAFIARIQTKVLTDQDGGQEQVNRAVISPAYVEGWQEPAKDS